MKPTPVPRIAAILVAMLISASALAGQGPAAEPLDPPALLAAYRDMGLPLPPPEAEFVISRGAQKRVDGEMRQMFTLSFHLHTTDWERGPHFLVGTEEPVYSYYGPPKGDLVPADPAKVPIPSIETAGLGGWAGGQFPQNCGLAIALQCEARGWHDLALALFEHSLQTPVPERPGVVSPRTLITAQPAHLPPKTALAHVAWAHLVTSLFQPNADWPALCRRMEALAASEPLLTGDPNKAALLNSLKLAIVPSAAAPGSLEAMIDELVNVQAEYSYQGATSATYDPRITRITGQGFAAVPAMIEHLDDMRLMRLLRPVQGNTIIPVYSCVGDYAKGFIRELIGDDQAAIRKLTTAPKQGAQEWWAEASKQDEEAYLLPRVLHAPLGNSQPPIIQVNLVVVQAIAARYPKRLPEVCQKIGLDPAVAAAIAASALPHDQKIDLLLQSPGPETAAQLARLDEEAFTKLLVQTYDNLPASYGPNGIRVGAIRTMADQAVLTSSPAVWAALLRATRRADPALRAAIIYCVDRCTDKSRDAVLAYLSQFLDDAAVSTDRNNAGGADVRNYIMEVRNLATANIAKILGVPPPSDDPTKTTTAQWAQYRSTVKAALEKAVRQ
jgi:hypothetical protein